MLSLAISFIFQPEIELHRLITCTKTNKTLLSPVALTRVALSFITPDFQSLSKSLSWTGHGYFFISARIPFLNIPF